MSERWGKVPIRAAGMRQLGKLDYRVLIAIAGHADGDGFARPGMAAIAAAAKTGRARVPGAVRRLETAGLIRTYRGAARANTNVYQLIGIGVGAQAGNTAGAQAGNTAGAQAGNTAGAQVGNTAGAQAGTQTELLNREGNSRAGVSAVELMVLDQEFQEWFSGYPERQGEHEAKREYQKARNAGVTREELIDGRDRYVAGKPDWQRWLNPASFIRRRRWRDGDPCAGPTGQRGMLLPMVGESDDRKLWRARLRRWYPGERDGRKAFWHSDWGPRIGEEGCWVPADLIDEVLRTDGEAA